MTMTFSWHKLVFGKCFGTSFLSNHWAGHCWLLNTIHFSSHVTIQWRNGSLLLCRIREDATSEWWYFLICSQYMRLPLIKPFYLSNFLQMLNNHRMVDVEFFGKFSFCCKRISFYDPLNWSLSTSNGWPLHSSSSTLWFALQTFLKHHCTVHSLAVPEPICCWCYELSLLLYDPFWIRTRKVLEFYFLSNSFLA